MSDGNYNIVLYYCRKLLNSLKKFLLIHVYIFVSCALLDVDVVSVQEVASVQRLMPHGNGQVNWVSYSLLCKHIQVYFLYKISSNVGIYLLLTKV